jgi:hypothetical protein
MHRDIYCTAVHVHRIAISIAISIAIFRQARRQQLLVQLGRLRRSDHDEAIQKELCSALVSLATSMSRGSVVSKLILTLFCSSSRAIERHDRSPRHLCTQPSSQFSQTVCLPPSGRLVEAQNPRNGVVTATSLPFSAPQTNRCQRTVQPTASSPAKADTQGRGPCIRPLYNLQVRRCVTPKTSGFVCQSNRSLGAFSSLSIPRFEPIHHETLRQVLSCATHTHISLSDGISVADEATQSACVHHRRRPCGTDSSCKVGREGNSIRGF